MADLVQAGLILEGGANRGIFTAGVLDYLTEQGIFLSYVVGVSAGACNALDYVSRQEGRTKDCIMPHTKETMYSSVKRVLKSRSLFDMDMIFEKYPNEIFPFDFDSYFQSEMDCEMVVTNCHTGRAEYKSENSDRNRLLQICRASSSIPILSPMVKLDGQSYVDGGVADSIPIIHSMRKGYRKNVVILTRNMGYRKKVSKKSRPLNYAALKGYPNLAKSLSSRAVQYNKILECVEKWEREGHIFVIRPEIKPIGRAEKDETLLEGFYRHGYEVMEEKLPLLEAYLNA